MRKFSLFASLFVFSLCFAEEPFREWTNLDGKKIKARFIEGVKGQVKVRRTDGRTFKIPLDQLSEKDRKYVKTLTFDPTDGLVAWYPFNGNAQDESGNGHHGKVIGATLCKNRKGNPDTAYNFDGVNDYIDLGSSPKLNPRDQMTITSWIMLPKNMPKVKSKNDQVLAEPIVERYQPNVGRRSYFTALYAGGYPRAYFYQDGGEPERGRGIGSKSNPEPLKLKQHYFLAVSFDHARWGYLFLDGEIISDLRYGDPIQQTKELTTIGGVINSKSKYFTGIIDDVRIYEKALSANDIKSLYELEK